MDIRSPKLLRVCNSETMDLLSQFSRTQESCCKWYQILSFCLHTGRYVASSKRCITWKFGSLIPVKPGLDEYEDHEVVLIWSLKSGKSKLSWNGRDITSGCQDFDRQRTSRSSIKFQWQSLKGTKFTAIAHANPVDGMNQYELLINGLSFNTLISKDECVRQRLEELSLEPPKLEVVSPEDDRSTCSDRDNTRMQRSVSIDIVGSDEMSGGGVYDPHQNSRLASAGFSYDLDIKDELRSDLFSSTLDYLRDELSSCVPVTEEMISRAIIHAFSEDRDCDTSSESYSIQTDGYLDSSEVEADILGETFSWLKRSQPFISSCELTDRKLEFLRKHVERMVSHVRHDRLKACVASQIIHRVALILKLEVAKELIGDTVIFRNLNSLTTTQDIFEVMKSFGDIQLAAVSREYEGFGFCRFLDFNVVQNVCNAAGDGAIEINGRKPDIFAIFHYPFSDVNETSKGFEVQSMDYGNEDIDAYLRDYIDPSEDGIEASFKTGSFRLFHISRHANTPPRNY